MSRDHPLGDFALKELEQLFEGLAGSSPESECVAFAYTLKLLLRRLKKTEEEAKQYESVDGRSVGPGALQMDIDTYRRTVKRLGLSILRAGREIGADVSSVAAFIGGCGSGFDVNVEVVLQDVKALHAELVARRLMDGDAAPPSIP